MIYRIVNALGTAYELGEGLGDFGPIVTEILAQSSAYQTIPCFRVFLSTAGYIDVYNPAEVWTNPNLHPSENLPKST